MLAVSRQRAPDQRRHAEAVVVIPRDVLSGGVDLRLAVHDYVDIREGRQSEDVGQRRAPGAQLLKDVHRERRAAKPSGCGIDEPLFSPKRDILPRAFSIVRSSTSSPGFLTG